MTPEQEKEMKDLQDRLKKIESLLFSTNNDTRFQANIRQAVTGFTPSSAKPYIILKNGDRYEITNVTKLN